MNIAAPLRSLGLSGSVLVSVLACACTAAGVGTTGALGGDGGTAIDVSPTTPDAGSASPRAQDCTGMLRSQAASQPCCLAYGIDACGAGLFCAAFDGRVQPTCYPERSRADGAECTGDAQCTSGSCNTERTACRSGPGAKCAASVGCASERNTFVCVAESCTLTKGRTGDPCASSSDCVQGACGATSTCLGTEGASCRQPNDCASDFCCKPSSGGSTCQDCRGNAGESCGLMDYPCRPGLECCYFPGSGNYCETKC